MNAMKYALWRQGLLPPKLRRVAGRLTRAVCLGPLLYHWTDVEGEISIELSFNLFVNYPRLAPFAELIKSVKIAVKDGV